MYLDINECLTGTACHINADCTNTDGSFECACRPGFVGDGINCAGWYFFLVIMSDNAGKLVLQIIPVIELFKL